ncbi:MAG: hypothetical protein ABJF23_27690 [Bryobacteraceae bacterium]
MAGRGATTFEKRQKEQNRKEKRQDKIARRLQKGGEGKSDTTDSYVADDVGTNLDRVNTADPLYGKISGEAI